MTDVLIVGRHEGRRRRMLAALRHGGYSVRSVNSVSDAGGVIRRNHVRAIVCIHSVPPTPDELHDLRVRTDAPIVIVSELTEPADQVAGLDAGADDYIAYPFDIDELLARLRARLRRVEHRREEPPLVIDDFIVYLADRRWILADGTEARLSPTEWKLVEVLLHRPGRLISQDEIFQSLYGEQVPPKSGLLRVHLASIRRKIEPDPARPRYFVTVPGLGLRFASDLSARNSAS